VHIGGTQAFLGVAQWLTEEMGEAQGCVAGDGAPSIQDLGHAVGRNIEPPRKRRGAHAQFPQFFRQMFARVTSGKCPPASMNGCRFHPQRTQLSSKSRSPPIAAAQKLPAILFQTCH
jgi:hypothetical protein